MPDNLGININSKNNNETFQRDGGKGWENYDGLLQYGLFPHPRTKSGHAVLVIVCWSYLTFCRPAPVPPLPAVKDNVCPTRLEQRWNNFVS